MQVNIGARLKPPVHRMLLNTHVKGARVAQQRTRHAKESRRLSPTSPAGRAPAAAITTKLQHDADAGSDDSHRVRCTGRENIGQHAVRKEEACGYLLRRTDGDMRRGLGWQRETSEAAQVAKCRCT